MANPREGEWASVRSGAREVVDGLAADGLGLEVLLYPRTDLRARAVGTTAAGTKAATADEVMDLALPHVLLELGERRRGISAVEAADRHHRLVTRELERRGIVRAHCCGRP